MTEEQVIAEATKAAEAAQATIATLLSTVEGMSGSQADKDAIQTVVATLKHDVDGIVTCLEVEPAEDTGSESATPTPAKSRAVKPKKGKKR
jgi:hypothetical protein